MSANYTEAGELKDSSKRRTRSAWGLLIAQIIFMGIIEALRFIKPGILGPPDPDTISGSGVGQIVLICPLET
jgi:hypothetical protein